MVRNANAIETAPAVKIDDFRQGQAPIGIVGVDVEVAKLHPMRAQEAGTCTAPALVVCGEQIQWTVWRCGLFALFENQPGNAKRGVRLTYFFKILTPLLPKSGFVSEAFFHEV